MKLTVIGALAAALIAAPIVAAPAFAQAQAQTWLSVSDVESRLTAQGFRVLEVERDDGHFEVQAYESNGNCVELDVHRSTGEIIRTKRDDDCGRYD